MGYRYDVVDAVLAEQSNNPAGSARAVRQLQAWVEREDWREILPGYARCVRILRAAGGEQRIESGEQRIESREQLLREEEERNLYQALQTVNHQPATINELLETIVALLPAINAFFDKVLVMAEDEAVRQNRLALVGQVADLSKGLADLSKLEGF